MDDIRENIVDQQDRYIKGKPSPAFVFAAWAALLIGFVSYNIGLLNAEMQLNEKGYYFTIMLFGLFSVVALQKNVRDKMDGLPVTDIFYAISWVWQYCFNYSINYRSRECRLIVK